MKFLIFNIAIIGALYYLFSSEVNETNDMAGKAQHIIERIETQAMSVVDQVREQARVNEDLEPAPAPALEAQPPRPVLQTEVLPPPAPPLVNAEATTPVSPALLEMGAQQTFKDEPAEETIPLKSVAERRDELLEMAQNMELYFLRKAGK
jgi:hypothetical protein